MTFEEILQALDDERITPAEARTQIVQLLIRDNPGISPEAALDRAQIAVSTIEGTRPSRGAGGLISGEAISPFGEDYGERRTAFEGLLGQRFPGGIPGVAQRALNRQFNVLSPSFEALRGIGAIPSAASFPQFLQSNLGRGGIDPRAVLGQVGQLFGRTDLEPEQETFRQGLLDQPEGQFKLILNAARQGLPAFLSQGLEGILRRRFGSAALQQGQDPETGLTAATAETPIEQYLRRRFSQFGRPQ